MDKMFSIILQVLVMVTVTYADVFSQTVLLNDGNRMPILSLGTIIKIDKLDEIKPAVIQAIESGYRHIDTAAFYQNEEQIGEAIADVISRGIVTREDLWITSKLISSIGIREQVLPGLKSSLKRLKLNYVDLYLIHTPENLFNASVYDLLEVWKGMEDVKKLNLTRSIGVSNFNFSDIHNILENSKTVPSAIEIEVNPTFSNMELVTYCQSKNIAVMSYAPFGFMVPRPWVVNPLASTFEEPILKQISLKYGKMPSQIVLRYLIDRGTIPVAKSTNMEHIKENIDVFDFQLSSEEVDSINELDRGVKVYNYDNESLRALLKYYYGIIKSSDLDFQPI